MNGAGPVDAEMGTITLKGRRITVPLTPGAPPPPTIPTVPAVVGPLPGGAAPPLPPAAPEPLLRRRHWWLVGGGVTIILVAVGVVLLLTGGDGADRQRATTLLQTSGQELQRVVDTASQASTRAGMESAGGSARASLAVLSRLQAQAVDVRSPRLRGPVEQALRAQADVVQGFARLSEIARKRRRLSGWSETVRPQIQAAQAQLTAAGGSLQTAGLTVPASPVLQDAAIGRAVAAIDGVVEDLED